MPITPSYLELYVKLFIGQENSIKHLPGKYVTSDLRLHSVDIDCQCCYSVCKPDIDLVLDVHPVERPARAYRNTSRAPRGRCLDPHVQVFLLGEHLGQGRYPIRLEIRGVEIECHKCFNMKYGHHPGADTLYTVDAPDKEEILPFY